jgi:hypothetical protein
MATFGVTRDWAHAGLDQDALAPCPPGAAAVFDGLGGHAGSEHASAAAAATVLADADGHDLPGCTQATGCGRRADARPAGWVSSPSFRRLSTLERQRLRRDGLVSYDIFGRPIVTHLHQKTKTA